MSETCVAIATKKVLTINKTRIFSIYSEKTLKEINDHDEIRLISPHTGGNGGDSVATRIAIIIRNSSLIVNMPHIVCDGNEAVIGLSHACDSCSIIWNGSSGDKIKKIVIGHGCRVTQHQPMDAEMICKCGQQL